jgi:hypothetical protein
VVVLVVTIHLPVVQDNLEDLVVVDLKQIRQVPEQQIKDMLVDHQLVQEELVVVVPVELVELMQPEVDMVEQVFVLLLLVHLTRLELLVQDQQLVDG